MGIRIHKMMGYGLTDVVENDERLNHEAPIFEYELDGEKHVEEYFAWVRETQYDQRGRPQSDVAESLRKHQEGRKHDLQDCIKWGTVDGGLENVLIIRPLAWPDWYRYDDAIDWAEQTYSKKGQRDEVKVLPHGLYPHVGYMDGRSGEKVKDDIFPWVRMQSYLRDYPEERALHEHDSSVIDELAQLAGFRDNKEAEAHVVPVVPDGVRWMTEFADLFTDKQTWLQLRPMIYTWWA